VPLPGIPLSLQPGVEFFLFRRFSLLNEISLQTNKNKDLDSTALNKKYFKYKIELRYYLLPRKKVTTPYFAAQYSTASRKFDVDKKDEYYDTSQDDSVYTYSKAKINSPVQTVTLQFGLAIKASRHFYFDASIGFGIRLINTTYSSVENLQKIRNVRFINIKPIQSYRYQGYVTRLQLNSGFRISYRF
ncbi:MAG: hypothetical protein ACRDE5_04715, partial [Ginsengibacter sp.]